MAYLLCESRIVMVSARRHSVQIKQRVKEFRWGKLIFFISANSYFEVVLRFLVFLSSRSIFEEMWLHLRCSVMCVIKDDTTQGSTLTAGSTPLCLTYFRALTEHCLSFLFQLFASKYRCLAQNRDFGIWQWRMPMLVSVYICIIYTHTHTHIYIYLKCT